MPHIIDGKKMAASLKAELAKKVASYQRAPGLAFVLVGDHGPSHTYVRMKGRACQEVGLHSEVHILPNDVSMKALLQKIEELNAHSLIDGIIVQMPLPPELNAIEVSKAIDPAKDVDGFHPLNLGQLVLGQTTGFYPCTPEGIIRLLQLAKAPTKGAHIVVLGRSLLVGSPLSILLSQKKAHGDATVTLAHSQTRNIASITKEGDIVIAAIGRPHFVKADMVKEGAFVIDVGINSVPCKLSRTGFTIVGDVDFTNVAPKCQAITPVPGGVGPMTIALLLEHTCRAYEKRKFIF